jgi:hypothetical protein
MARILKQKRAGIQHQLAQYQYDRCCTVAAAVKNRLFAASKKLDKTSFTVR